MLDLAGDGRGDLEPAGTGAEQCEAGTPVVTGADDHDGRVGLHRRIDGVAPGDGARVDAVELQVEVEEVGTPRRTVVAARKSIISSTTSVDTSGLR